MGIVFRTESQRPIERVRGHRDVVHLRDDSTLAQLSHDLPAMRARALEIDPQHVDVMTASVASLALGRPAVPEARERRVVLLHERAATGQKLIESASLCGR